MSLAGRFDLIATEEQPPDWPGHDVEAEFRRMVVAMKSVRKSLGASDTGHRVGCRRRAHRRTKGIYGILRERIGDAIHRIKLHFAQSNEDTSRCFQENTAHHAAETRPERKLDASSFLEASFVPGCSANHPLAANDQRGEDLLEFSSIA